MKQLRHNTYNSLLVALLLMLLQSCINDDLSDCDAPKHVYFNYRPATYAITNVKEGINPEDVTRMDLFVFDEKGVLVQQYTDESPQMSPTYYMTVEGLNSGNYFFIAWGSLKGQYSLVGENIKPGVTTIEELQVHLNCIKDNMVTDFLSPLFFATHAEKTLEIHSMIKQRFNLDMIQDTYTFNVSVSGAGMNKDYISKGSFHLDISDNNGKYKFDNSFTSCQKFNYIRTCTVSEKQPAISGNISVMRLEEGRSPTMKIMDTDNNDTIIEDNIMELFSVLQASGYPIDLRYQHEFDIDYFFTGVPGEIQITINGWEIIKKNGDLSYY